MSLRLTLARRFGLARAGMALLVLAAISAGLVLLNIQQARLEAAELSSKQVQQVSGLQAAWQQVSHSVDSMILTEQIEGVDRDLTTRVDNLHILIASLDSNPPGHSAETLTATSGIAHELASLEVELGEALRQIKAAGTESRWQDARNLYENSFTPINQRMNAHLESLQALIDKDITQSLSTARGTYRQTALTWSSIILVLAAVVSALLFYTSRSLSTPVNELIRRVDRITQGDFSPQTALPNQGELGELSQAIARMTGKLHESYITFEQRVAERTHDLERRSAQMQAAAQVARDITTTQNLDELLDHTVRLVRERFDFYHAGVFLVDQAGEFAILRAATGEAGQAMLDHGHKLRVGLTGIVGMVCASGKPRIALDVDLDRAHYKNPWLPETRSEMALPLRLAGRTIGALDVQSQLTNAFEQDDIAALQVIADQLAIAIQNVRLLEAAQASLREMETYQSSITGTAWSQIQKNRTLAGYEYRQGTARPLHLSDSTEPDYEDGVPASGEVPAAPVSVPIQIRGTPVGEILIWPAQERFSEADQNLLEELSSRLSQAMESARLFQETQSRAAREQAINQIASQVRSSVDVETVLRNTIRELGRTLGATHTYIQIDPNLDINTPAADSDDKPDASSPRGNGNRPHIPTDHDAETRFSSGTGEFPPGNGNGHR